jgi:hypothetical protein
MKEISEHLRGPWRAQLLDNGSRETAIVEDARAVRVARGDGLKSLIAYPTSALRNGVLYEIQYFDDEAELRARWEQATAVAELLNGLPGQSSTEPGA